MKLLISATNIEEVKIVARSGAEIIDIKNPREGSLGANFPWIIRHARKITGNKTLSATIGDFDHRPGMASLAAYGAAYAGAEYVKIGMKVSSLSHARELLRNVSKAVHSLGKKVVAAGYADYSRLKTVSPFQILSIAQDTDVVMIDTGMKDGRKLFDFLSDDELISWKEDAKNSGMRTALAGKLEVCDVERLRKIGPDIIGVRSSVCESGRNGRIKPELIKEFLKKI